MCSSIFGHAKTGLSCQAAGHDTTLRAGQAIKHARHMAKAFLPSTASPGGSLGCTLLSDCPPRCIGCQNLRQRPENAGALRRGSAASSISSWTTQTRPPVMSQHVTSRHTATLALARGNNGIGAATPIIRHSVFSIRPESRQSANSCSLTLRARPVPSLLCKPPEPALQASLQASPLPSLLCQPCLFQACLANHVRCDNAMMV